MRLFYSLLKLARVDSSLLIALAAFVPLLARTKDLGLSLSKSFPLLFIGMCTFIANDLDDVERDRINHPERPLPSGHVKPEIAAALYFLCLASALFSTKFYIHSNVSFWYYLLLAVSISYGHVVECFPGFKSLYVAGAISVPVLIVAISYPNDRRLCCATGSVFLLVLGRELCMDIVDRSGDEASFMHRVKEGPLAIIAFSLQVAGLSLLASQASDLLDLSDLLLIALLIALAGRCWFKLASYKKAIALMKVQLFIGLYFLT